MRTTNIFCPRLGSRSRRGSRLPKEAKTKGHCRRCRSRRGVSAAYRLPDRTVRCWTPGGTTVLNWETHRPGAKRGGSIPVVGAPAPTAALRLRLWISTIWHTRAISPGHEAYRCLSIRTVSASRAGQTEEAMTRARFQMSRVNIPQTILYSRDISSTSARQPRRIWIPQEQARKGERLRHRGSR